MSRYNEILKGLNEAIDFEKGKKNGTIVHKLEVKEVKEFTPAEIKKIRIDSNMTQSLFASCIGVTKKAVEGWEGGRSKPDGAARRTLGLMQENKYFARDVGILSN